MATVPMWKERRAAPRATDVLARRKQEANWLAAFEASLGKSAAAFIELYDRWIGRTKTRQTATESKHTSAATLLTELRGWAALASTLVPTVKRGDYGDRPDVPDDVISDVEQLIVHVDEHEEQTGTKLDFSDTMRSDLQAALTAAKVEWGMAGQAAGAYSDVTDELRAAAARFHKDLVAFRAAIGHHLGTHHADYQALRTNHVTHEEQDDEADEPEESEAAELTSGKEGEGAVAQ